MYNSIVLELGEFAEQHKCKANNNISDSNFSWEEYRNKVGNMGELDDNLRVNRDLIPGEFSITTVVRSEVTDGIKSGIIAILSQSS